MLARMPARATLVGLTGGRAVDTVPVAVEIRRDCKTDTEW